MKLYYKPGACSLASHIVLCESGLKDFSIEKVDLATKKTEHGNDFYKINPKGQVPTLQLEGGVILTEGVAIMQYLADLAPEKHLIPEHGKIARYHAIEWLNYIATEVHKGFGPLFNPKTPEEYREITKEKLKAQFTYLNGVLSKQQYLLGENFSVADAYLFTVLGWTKFAHIDLAAYPAIVSYLDRVGQRPAVKAALQAENG
jgi:glutathione S-transferase